MPIVLIVWVLTRHILRARSRSRTASAPILEHRVPEPITPAPATNDPPQPPHGLRRAIWRVTEVGLTVSIMAAVCVYIGLPTMRIVQAESRRANQPQIDRVSEQIEVDPVALSSSQRRALDAFPRTSKAPAVLTYHDISPTGGRWTVTPETFATHMAALDAAGYRTITAKQFIGFVAGRATLPPRSFLLTFDDGTHGTWIYADRVLRRYGFTAVSFLVTGLVGTSDYYLSWAEIRKMRESGLWSFQDHTHNGHRLVQTMRRSRGSSFTPFLTNRMWLVDKGRTESAEEYRTRIRSDLERSLSVFRSHGLPRPSLFAFPFGTAFGATNDPDAAAVGRSEVLSRFRYAFVTNANPCTSKEARTSRILDRTVVLRESSVHDVLFALQAAGPRRVAKDSNLACSG